MARLLPHAGHPSLLLRVGELKVVFHTEIVGGVAESR